MLVRLWSRSRTAICFTLSLVSSVLLAIVAVLFYVVVKA